MVSGRTHSDNEWVLEPFAYESQLFGLESNRPAGTHGNLQLMQKQPATVADLAQITHIFSGYPAFNARAGWQVCRQVPWVSLGRA